MDSNPNVLFSSHYDSPNLDSKREKWRREKTSFRLCFESTAYCISVKNPWSEAYLSPSEGWGFGFFSRASLQQQTKLSIIVALQNMHWSSIAEPFAVKIHVSKCHVTKRVERREKKSLQNPMKGLEFGGFECLSGIHETSWDNGFPNMKMKLERASWGGSHFLLLKRTNLRFGAPFSAPFHWSPRNGWTLGLMELLSDATWQVPSTATLGPLLLLMTGRHFCQGIPFGSLRQFNLAHL